MAYVVLQPGTPENPTEHYLVVSDESLQAYLNDGEPLVPIGQFTDEDDAKRFRNVQNQRERQAGA